MKNLRNFASSPVLNLETMEDQFPNQQEKLWRRQLSGAERAELRGQPEMELEAQLTDALAHLSSAPVPSNFTARVMAAIELEDRRSARVPGRRWNWHALLPRLAVGTAVLLFVGLGLQQHQVSQRRAEMRQSLSVVASATAPSVEVLENLEVIQRMSQTTHADTELLVDLQ